MSEEVLIFVEGKAGRIRLNRPKALHALNTAMCATISAALDAWRGDPRVEIVMIDHAMERGFCAGGDIRMLTESGAADGLKARQFFHTEYRMNHRLFTYDKPSIAFMDGVTMGGGVGIAMPCSLRVATENTRFAMPETGIGLFPDVGGGWYLSRLADRVGQFLALTGARVDGADCVALGLATHYLSAKQLGDAKRRIAETPVEAKDVLAELAPGLPEARIDAHRDRIARLFASNRLEDVFAALEADGSDWAAKELTTLQTKSPQTMKVALRLLAEGAAIKSFADEMKQEYAVACRVVRRPDFLEGVRAVIVDKDNAPRWDPATPEAVTADIIYNIFAPLPTEEAWTPG